MRKAETMKVELTEDEKVELGRRFPEAEKIIQRKVDQALAQAAPNPVTEDEARDIYLELARRPGVHWPHWDTLTNRGRQNTMEVYNLARGVKPEEPTPTSDPYDAVLTILDKRGAELPEVRKRLEELLTAEQRVEILERALREVSAVLDRRGFSANEAKL